MIDRVAFRDWLRRTAPSAGDLREGFRDLLPLFKIGAVLFVVAGVVVQLQRRTFRPPGGAKTIAELHRAGEPVRRLARTKVDGRNRYVWIGGNRWLAAPSGPACFVFNERGQLEQFTPTTGDGELGGICDAGWTEPQISVDEAINATPPP